MVLRNWFRSLECVFSSFSFWFPLNTNQKGVPSQNEQTFSFARTHSTGRQIKGVPSNNEQTRSASRAFRFHSRGPASEMVSGQAPRSTSFNASTSPNRWFALWFSFKACWCSGNHATCGCLSHVFPHFLLSTKKATLQTGTQSFERAGVGMVLEMPRRPHQRGPLLDLSASGASIPVRLNQMKLSPLPGLPSWDNSCFFFFLPRRFGRGSKPMVPFSGTCTTHFSLFFGDECSLKNHRHLCCRG